jgi:hypothetical protein
MWESPHHVGDMDGKVPNIEPKRFIVQKMGSLCGGSGDFGPGELGPRYGEFGLNLPLGQPAEVGQWTRCLFIFVHFLFIGIYYHFVNKFFLYCVIMCHTVMLLRLYNEFIRFV